MRTVFTIILILHGVIHSLGFLKAFNLAKLDQVSLTISKQMGIFWGLTGLLFVVTTILYTFKKDWWWIPGISATLFSQILIVLYWPDAKFGSLANIIILLLCIISYGKWNVDRSLKTELDSFSIGIIQNTDQIEEDSIKHLPHSVQKWLRQSNVIGKSKAKTVHLFQSGQMKIKTDGNWLSVRAEQWFRTDKPGFIWNAEVRAGSIVQFSGRDKYETGKGNMIIKLFSLFPVVNARGPEIDQGVAVRYLAEIIWFPSAAVSEFITWEELEPLKAKATMHYGEIKVTGIFSFNETGQVVRFEANRFYDKTNSLMPWLIEINEASYSSFDEISIPTMATVTWKLNDGNFTWYQLEIENIEYNK